MSDSKDSKRCETKLLKYQLALIEDLQKLPADVCLLIGQYHRNPPKAGDLKKVLKRLPKVKPCRFCSKPAWKKIKIHEDDWDASPSPICTGCSNSSRGVFDGGSSNYWYESTTYPFVPHQQRLAAQLAAHIAKKRAATPTWVMPPGVARFAKYQLP